MSLIICSATKLEGVILVSPCPSVCPSVQPSVCPSVCLSVCRQILCRTITWVVFLRIKILSAVYWWREEDPFHFWRFSLLPFQNYWTWYDGKYNLYPMSYDNLSSVSQNVLKFYQQLTGEEKRVPFIFGRNNQ
jgi:hypothetical protein